MCAVNLEFSSRTQWNTKKCLINEFGFVVKHTSGCVLSKSLDKLLSLEVLHDALSADSHFVQSFMLECIQEKNTAWN